MLITVEGKFKDGRVELVEAPADVREAKVIVTFLPPAAKANGATQIQFGMFKGARTTEPEDFRVAEILQFNSPSPGTPGEGRGGLRLNAP